jgi:dihydroorotate dehydrogenase (fumarate)
VAGGSRQFQPSERGGSGAGLSAWISSKGFAALDELRGILSVPVGSEEQHERMGYVNALRAANAGV